jgi:hypothetical protein
VNRKIGIAILLFFVGGGALAQVGSPERKATKNILGKRWERAKEQLQKALAKEPVNPAAEYLFTQYFFHPGNPAFNIDSAYKHVTKSLNDFTVIPAKERERLKRFPIDSAAIVMLRTKIDSAAFERTKQINTEEAFLRFLADFPLAAQRSEAITLRDEAAFLEAMKANTYEAFFNYYEKYPAAARAGEALNKYHQLLFEAKTESKRLADYERFLEEFPSTPYRAAVEKNIFEISTASGSLRDLISFMRKFPGSSFAERARNIAFHLLEESDGEPALKLVLNDSLSRIRRLNANYLVPVLKDGKYSFMDRTGKELVQANAARIPDEYRCGNITDDVLFIDDRLISRDGSLILQDSLSDLEDLGSGFMKFRTGNCLRVIHKSGFTINPCVADARIVAGKFLALKQNNLWFVTTLGGKPLIGSWDDVSQVHDVVVFKKNNKYQLCTAESLAASANQESPGLSEQYDEVKPWLHGMIWIRKAASEGLLDQHLKTVIVPGNRQLKQTFFGGIMQSDRSSTLISNRGRELQSFAKVVMHQPWVAGKNDSTWRLMAHSVDTFIGKVYDSIRFTGPFAVGAYRDSIEVFLNPGVSLKFPAGTKLSFIAGTDSTAFLGIQQEKKKTVYTSKGQKYFTVEYDDIQYAGEGMFIVTRKDKKGLLSAQGKLVIPAEYDAIGTVTNHVVSLLRNMKFGAYHVKNKTLLKPQYDKNLIYFNPGLLAAFQKGKYGFIGWDNKPLGKVQFDEMEHWTDTLALIKNNFTWSLYNTVALRVAESGITEIDYIVDSPDEKLAIVKQDNAFGVLSNRRGFIIPATFTNLVNVGTADEPLYFTEKHVEEALIFVVIYYDASGNMLLRRVYEEADYERILCSDN